MLPPSERGGYRMSDCITVTINRKHEVIDLEDFAALFFGLGAQFDTYLKNAHPDVHGHAQMGIRELRHGCIIFELVAVILPEIINRMDEASVLYGFVELVKQKITQLGNGNFLSSPRKSELRDMANIVRAIAKDADASAEFEYKERDKKGIVRKEISLRLNTKQARQVLHTVERQKEELDKTEGADHVKVLMHFRRADVGDAKLAKKSGELVVIEDISDRALPLIYQSDIAGDRIKSGPGDD